MTPTKKIIAEVTEAATLANFSVENALSMLAHCSLADYKVLGAEYIVKSAKQAFNPKATDLLEEVKRNSMVYISKERNRI